MNLRVLLPFQVFADITQVLRIVAEGPCGAFGILPRRLDGVAVLDPGILMYETAGDTVYLAVDAGVLVKTGAEVHVCVRRALGGKDLGALRAEVVREFLAIGSQEQSMRSAMAKLESGFLHGFARLKDA